MVVGLDSMTNEPVWWAALAALAQEQPQLQFWSQHPMPADFQKHMTSTAGQVQVWLYGQLPQKRAQQPYVFLLAGHEVIFSSGAPAGLRRFWERRRLHTFLQQAGAITVPTPQHRQHLINEFNVPAQRLHLLNACIPPEQVLADEIKQQWGGTEAFAATGTDMITALKAFSAFKKRQQSGWKLIWLSDDVVKAQAVLTGYKYKDDVQVRPLADGPSVLPAVYALVCTTPHLWWHSCIITAWQCGVPVIAQKNAAVTQQGPDAVHAVETGAPESFAAGLMELYKDEALHQRLSLAAQNTGRLWSAHKTVQDLKAVLAAAAPTFVAAKKES